MHDAEPLLSLLLLVALGLVVVQTWRLSRARGDARSNASAVAREEERAEAARARGARAVEGEGDAVGILARAGYAVVDRQVAGSWTMRADGEPVTFGLRADYLVARGDRRYIAEVKTGRLAPKLAHGPTRRQLLEYGAAFDVEGVILVDADAGTVTRVEIDSLGPSRHQGPSWRGAALVAALCAGLGVLAGLALGGQLPVVRPAVSPSIHSR